MHIQNKLFVPFLVWFPLFCSMWLVVRLFYLDLSSFFACVLFFNCLVWKWAKLWAVDMDKSDFGLLEVHRWKWMEV